MDRAPTAFDRSVSTAMQDMRRRDAIGQRVHGVLAMVYLGLLPLATTPKDIALILLVGYALIRLPNTWRCYAPLLRDPLLLALLAWTAWTTLSLTWSVDAAEGAKDLRTLRMVLVPWALWPVIDWTPRLVAAFLAGTLAHGMVQGFQFLQWFGMDPEGKDGRLRGLLHPIQTGALALAAACWYTAGVLRPEARLWIRLLLLAGAAASLASLLAAGSRGPWLAAAVAIPVTVASIAVRRPPSRRAVLLASAALLVAGGLCWPLMRGFVGRRLEAAKAELVDAKRNEQYDSSLGLRVLMWGWAWEYFKAHPIRGIGIGSFRALAEDEPEAAPLRNYRPKGHPHATVLHVLCTTGIVGGCLLALVLWLSLARGARETDDHLFAGAALGVFVSWIIGSMFDSYETNGNLLGLFTFVITITLPGRSAASAAPADTEPGREGGA